MEFFAFLRRFSAPSKAAIPLENGARLGKTVLSNGDLFPVLHTEKVALDLLHMGKIDDKISV